MINNYPHANANIEDLLASQRRETIASPAIFEHSKGHKENLGSQILAEETVKTSGRNER